MDAGDVSLSVWCGMLCVAACAACMVGIVRSDLATRTIPRKLCWTLGVAGLLAQAFLGGMSAAVGSIWMGLVAGTMCLVAILLKAPSGQRFRIGGGDLRCMIALALATGDGAWAGAAACFASAALVACARLISGSLKPGDSFPFAPFLAVWFAVGALYLL